MMMTAKVRTAAKSMFGLVIMKENKAIERPRKNTREPKLELVGRYDESAVKIEVIDNGPGIIKEALEHIFVPFYTTKRTGSGIGLSLSRQIMQMHNGSITVESEPDVRTVFTLRF